MVEIILFTQPKALPAVPTLRPPFIILPNIQPVTTSKAISLVSRTLNYS